MNGRSRSAPVLAARSWAYRTRRFRALGWDFGIRTDDVALGKHLDDLLDALAADGEPAHWYSFVVSSRPAFTRYRLYRDGERVLDSPDGSRTLQHLLWDVNQSAFRSTPERMLVHAAAVAQDGRALVMSAPSGSGKTTLALGLVARGLAYLSDEAAAIDPETLLVHPYAKPLAVETGTQQLVPSLQPPHDDALAPFTAGPWQLAPGAIGATVSAPVPVGWIVFPHYAEGAATVLTPYSRALALARLVEQGLNLHPHGRHGFERMAEVVAGARCAELVMGDLDAACGAILEELGRDRD